MIFWDLVSSYAHNKILTFIIKNNNKIFIKNIRKIKNIKIIFKIKNN